MSGSIIEDIHESDVKEEVEQTDKSGGITADFLKPEEDDILTKNIQRLDKVMGEIDKDIVTKVDNIGMVRVYTEGLSTLSDLVHKRQKIRASSQEQADNARLGDEAVAILKSTMGKGLLRRKEPVIPDEYIPVDIVDGEMEQDRIALQADDYLKNTDE